MALLGIPDISKIVIDALRYQIEHDKIELHGFVIMEHHLHLIASGESLSKDIGIFKSYTARCIIDYLQEHHFNSILEQMKFYKKRHKTEQEYQVWEEGSHPQLVTNKKMLNQKLNYIHFNPVRADYIDVPLHWTYSSCRYFSNMECILPISLINQGLSAKPT